MGVPYEEVEVEVLLERTQRVTVTHYVQVSAVAERDRNNYAIEQVREAWESIPESMWEQHPPEIGRSWETSSVPRVVGVDVA